MTYLQTKERNTVWTTTGKVNTEQTWNTQYLLTTTGRTTPQAPDSTTKAQILPSPRRPRLPDPRQINSRFRPA